MFIRVKDKDSGHEFDVPEEDWRIDAGFFEPVKQDLYPPIDSPRPPKHHVQIEEKEPQQ